MSSSHYEIVMLSQGEFALQRADQRGEPLVRIRFSEEATQFLQDSGLDIARAMIDAGIDAVEQMNSEDNGQNLESSVNAGGNGRILH